MGYDIDTGKILFDSFHDRDETIAKFSEYNVISMWAEVVTQSGTGFNQVARPTIKIKLKGNGENDEEIHKI